MADKVIVTKNKITAVAEAIREKTGSSDTLTLDQMPEAIGNISGGGSGEITKVKLPAPSWYIDSTTDKLYIFRDPLTTMFGDENWLKFYDNDVEIPSSSLTRYMSNSSKAFFNDSSYGVPNAIGDTAFAIHHKFQNVTSYENGTASSSFYAGWSSIYDIPQVKGTHNFKLQSICSGDTREVRSYVSDKINSIGDGNTKGGHLQAIITTIPVPVKSSDTISLAPYTINEYSINTENLSLNGSTSGVLNQYKIYSGTLLNYTKSINFLIDPTKAGNNITGSSSYYEASVSNDIIKNAYGSYTWNNTCYVRVKFTLTETKNISFKYSIVKKNSSYGNYEGIWFGALDQELSKSVSQVSKTGITNTIYYAGDGSSADNKVAYNDSTEYTYTYENVEAGEHFIQIRMFTYYSSPDYRSDITITPVYEKNPTGYYFPSSITVTDSDTNEAITNYSYDPYTGEFSVPMTHSWNMSAIGSTIEGIISKLLNYSCDTKSSTLTIVPPDNATENTKYNYSLDNGTTWNVSDTNEITVSGLEPSSDYYTIPVYCSDSTMRPSNTLKCNFYYNPNYSTFFNSVKHISDDLVPNIFTIGVIDSKVYGTYLTSAAGTYVYDLKDGSFVFNKFTTSPSVSNYFGSQLVYDDTTEKFYVFNRHYNTSPAFISKDLSAYGSISGAPSITVAATAPVILDGKVYYLDMSNSYPSSFWYYDISTNTKKNYSSKNVVLYHIQQFIYNNKIYYANTYTAKSSKYYFSLYSYDPSNADAGITEVVDTSGDALLELKEDDLRATPCSVPVQDGQYIYTAFFNKNSKAVLVRFDLENSTFKAKTFNIYATGYNHDFFGARTAIHNNRFYLFGGEFAGAKGAIRYIDLTDFEDDSKTLAETDTGEVIGIGAFSDGWYYHYISPASAIQVKVPVYNGKAFLFNSNNVRIYTF